MKIIYHITIFLLLSVTLAAQGLMDLEYFIDSDPGFGDATSVSIPAPQADGTYDFDFDINTSGLPTGVHTLYVRAKDVDNEWSLLQFRTFMKIGSGTGGSSDIELVEYFIDEDPGFGNGTSIPAPTPEADSTYNFDFTIDVSALTNGIHTLYVRARDANDTWSLLQNRTFLKLFSGSMGVPNITTFEYYVNQPDSIQSYSNFAAAEDVTVDIPVDINQLDNGTHTFYVRAKDSNNAWGFWLEETFVVDNSTLIVPSFTVNNNCIGTDITFNNTSQGLPNAVSVFWDFGDGTTSNEESPAHTYASIGNYTVTLTLTGTNGVNYDFSEQIEVKARPTLNIRVADCFSNQAEYEVMEEGIVHHHFILEDANGTPYPNAKLYYRIGTSTAVDSSTVSDEQGFMDLEIKTSGEQAGDSSDDLIALGTTQSITLDSVALNIQNPAFCHLPEIVVNDFVPFSIGVVPHESMTEKYGLLTKGGVGVGACLGCFGFNEVGISAIDAGLGLNGTAKFEIEDDFFNNELIGFHVEVTNSLGIDAEVELFTFDLPLVSGNLADAGVDFNFKLYNDFYLSRNNVDDMITGMFSLTTIFPPFDPSITTLHPLNLVLGSYLADIGETIEETSVGGGYGYEFLPEAGLLNFEAGELNFGASFSLESASGHSEFYLKNNLSQLELTTGLRNFDYYDFAQFDLFAINYELTPVDFKRGFEVITTKSKITNSLLKGEICDITNGVLDPTVMLNIPFSNKEYTNKLKLNYDCVSWLEDESFNTTYDNGLANVLVHNGGKTPFFISTPIELSNDLNDLSDHIKQNFPYEWGEGTYVNEVTKKYATKYDFEWDFNIKLAFIGGAEATLESGAELFFTSEYPYYNSYYCDDLDKFVKTADHHDTESVVESFDPDIFDYFFSALEAAVMTKINEISVYVEDLFTQTTATIGDISDIIWFYNATRNVFEKNNDEGKSYEFEDYSLLTVGIVNDDTVFEFDTDINFGYYYPAGGVQGVAAVSLDTFVVVSDVFYLDAVYQGDTLLTAPNGDFLVFTELGMDDLGYLGLPEDAITNVYYKGYNDTLWTTLGTVGDTLTHNGLGNYAIGVTLAEDNNAPMVEITIPGDYQETKQITAIISDIESGINWSSVGVTANGMNIPYERIDYTNEIIIDLDTLDSSGEYSIIVYARDNRLNYGLDIALVEILVGVDKPQVFELINKIYPNPTDNILMFSTI